MQVNNEEGHDRTQADNLRMLVFLISNPTLFSLFAWALHLYARSVSDCDATVNSSVLFLDSRI
jgi:heme/copper-type cytochrome/quinol oxidase subunit 3